METFSKTEHCPPSDLLVEFQKGGTDDAIRVRIRRHLQSCEFCSAEVEFYRCHEPVAETPIADEIPRPLFELADALLHRRRDDISFIFDVVDRP